MFTNLVGVAGLAAIAAAVGALAGDWWWSALAGGVFAVALAVVAQYNAVRLPAEADVPAEVPRIPRVRSSA